MKVQVLVINAFSINGIGGNPAGVVFNADKLNNIQKQSIATAAGFPETAFVSASSLADFKLDFFTPTKQIPHCGHATIATFNYLKSVGRIVNDASSKETIDGLRAIEFRNGKAFMEQRSPTFIAINDVGKVLQSLHLEKADLLPELSPAIVNTGNSYLIVPVRNAEILAGISYDKEAVYRISEKYGLIGYYPYTHSNDYDSTARMFAPFYGINEEAGTGMAAGPLAVYLHEVGNRRQHRYTIEQGRYMNPASPSAIEVELEISDDGKIKRLFAGGAAHVSRQEEVELP